MTEPHLNDHRKEIENLVIKYNDRLYRVIHNFTFQPQQTEDILQEFWINVMKNYHRFEHRSHIFTWLYRIAVNTAFSYLKKIPKTQDYQEDADHRNTCQPEMEYEKAQLRQRINQAIAKLKKNQKEVFILRTYQDLPYSEISEMMDISVNSAKTTYFYALQKLKNELKGELQ